MAKDKGQPESAPAQEQTNGAAQAAPATTSVASNVVMVTHPGTGQPVRRTDYIRELWKAGTHTRGQIAKHLTELNEKAGIKDPKNPTQTLKVPYQAVFAVIKKGTPGGPQVATAQGSAAPQAPTIEAGQQS
jgi:hypothetical protein